jgi:hypothetical protein
MAAPEFVPTRPQQTVRSYSSPPWRPDPWFADRPGEVRGRQPEGDQLGVPGPDQGYALLLAGRYSGRVALSEGEHEADALAGATAIGTKRSAIFGRSPVLHDITVGLTVWGFLDPAPPEALLVVRREWFEEVHLPMHYTNLRRIADAVPEAVLRRPHDAVAAAYRSDWRSCLDLGG